MKNRIAEFRKKNKLSQPELAAMIGTPHYQILQRWEAGTNIPSLESAILLARALNTTVEELFPLDD